MLPSEMYTLRVYKGEGKEKARHFFAEQIGENLLLPFSGHLLFVFVSPLKDLWFQRGKTTTHQDAQGYLRLFGVWPPLFRLSLQMVLEGKRVFAKAHKRVECARYAKTLFPSPPTPKRQFLRAGGEK